MIEQGQTELLSGNDIVVDQIKLDFLRKIPVFLQLCKHIIHQHFKSIIGIGILGIRLQLCSIHPAVCDSIIQIVTQTDLICFPRQLLGARLVD